MEEFIADKSHDDLAVEEDWIHVGDLREFLYDYLVPETKHFEELIPQRLNTEEFFESWKNWIAYRKEKKKPITESTARRQLNKLNTLIEPDLAIQTIESSIEHGWLGLFPAETRAQKWSQILNGNL